MLRKLSAEFFIAQFDECFGSHFPRDCLIDFKGDQVIDHGGKNECFKLIVITAMAQSFGQWQRLLESSEADLDGPAEIIPALQFFWWGMSLRSLKQW